MKNHKRATIAILVAILLVASIYVIIRSPAPLGSIIVPDDYSTIQTAIDHAFAGQTIFVRNGVYHEQHITIDKRISLIGENSNHTILEGINNVKYPPPYVIQISANNVLVSGFTITNGFLGGIRVETLGSVNQPTGCTITGNNIMNNSYGISTYGGEDLSISKNNIFNNNEYGIYETSSHSIISENTITQNGWAGIVVDSCNNVTIVNNSIMGNGNQGNDVIEDQGGVYLRWNGNFNLYSNNITNNEGYGVQFGEGCSNSVVHDNNIKGNNVGVNLLNFAFTNGSDIGIGVDNTVYENNFDNKQNVYIETALPYNISNVDYVNANGTDVVSWNIDLGGNYWSDYNGHGAYIIDKNNVDHHPLAQHVSISTTAPVLFLNTLTIAIIAIVIIVILVAGLLVYFKKPKHVRLNGYE